MGSTRTHTHTQSRASEHNYNILANKSSLEHFDDDERQFGQQRCLGELSV